MKKVIFYFTVTVILIGINSISSAQDLAGGETSFKQLCAACHTVGKGRLVGPDLVGVSQRRPVDWIIKFVKSSQSMIKGGDKYADSIFQAFNKTLMPDHPTLNDEQIKNILAFIDNKSTAPSTTTEPSAEKTVAPKQKFLTTTNIILLVAIMIMLLVIFSLARINKTLLDQIKDFYSSDKSFYRKK